MKPRQPSGTQPGYVLVDAVAYDDQAPWPESADGEGPSLHRTSSAAFGAFASSWRAAAPSPGTAAPAKPGDLNHDSSIGPDDVAALVMALNDANAYETTYGASPAVSGDLDKDGDLDFDDLDELAALLAPAAASASLPASDQLARPRTRRAQKLAALEDSPWWIPSAAELRHGSPAENAVWSDGEEWLNRWTVTP
jgi:hypothetical protein